MVPEAEAPQEGHQVRLAVRVLRHEELEDVDLALGLLLEAGLVLDDLQGDGLLVLVVLGLEDFPEGAFAQVAEDLVPVLDVVPDADPHFPVLLDFRRVQQRLL